MRYPTLLLKRRLEDLLMLPLILAGRIVSRLKPAPAEYRHWYFFSFYHIGGAEKVHAQITQATGGQHSIIVFTRKAHNDLLLSDFRSSGCRVWDISRYTDNKWLYFLNILMRGLISGYINRQQLTPVVFNGQCNMGYKISPWVAKGIRQIELIHSFNTFSWIRLPFLPFIERTVMISRRRMTDHSDQYRQVGVPASFESRIVYISNAAVLPATLSLEDKDPVTILYSGRGGLEKRIPLTVAIMTAAYEQNPALHFEIMGDVSNVIDPAAFPFIRFHGNVSDPLVIAEIYRRSSILLLTSETEGFPMVIIEAMGSGNAIISTPVGDIPVHVQTGRSGYLFTDPSNADLIVREGTAYILNLAADPGLLRTIREHNRAYALSHFGIAQFNRHYQQLIDPTPIP